MKETEEKPEEWAEFDKEMNESGKFVKLEVDKPYKVIISSAKLVTSDKFKDSNGNPKKQMELTIDKLNGEPCGKIWTTGSWSVMKEIRKAMKDGSLARSVFLVKKKQDGDRKSYIFEKMEEFQAPAKSGRIEEQGERVKPLPQNDFVSKRDELGAFL